MILFAKKIVVCLFCCRARGVGRDHLSRVAGTLSAFVPILACGASPVFTTFPNNHPLVNARDMPAPQAFPRNTPLFSPALVTSNPSPLSSFGCLHCLLTM